MSSDALNGICPYYTMYPLDFPLRVLKRFGRRGDWVIDPFCGRGTTNFAARLLAMPSIGLDSSPVAAALARAKISSAEPSQIITRAIEIIEMEGHPEHVPTGEFWSLAYHEETLVQLCKLREALLTDCSSSVDILLRAILLGALHGPRPKGAPSYFSNQAPRTFAPKPNYAVKFWNQRDLRPANVDVTSVVRARAERILAGQPSNVDGIVRMADSRDPQAFSNIPRARVVVTSPPYFGMRTYLPDQWLRLWFLGGPSHVVYRQPDYQLRHSGVDRFASEMRAVWRNMASHTDEGARLVIRYGGIHDRDAEPMDVLKRSLVDSGWKITTARAVPDAEHGRRQVKQFQAAPKKAIAEYDVYCHKDGAAS